jgi:hypothetical protein
MNFTVAQIGDKTENGNRIVKLSIDTSVETALGEERRAVTYYKAVKDGTLKVKEGDEIALELDNYAVVERPFVHPESGDEIMLKWLHLK